MALANGTNNPVNGDPVLVNGSSSGAAGVKIKNKAALKRAKQKKAKLTAASRESSVVCILPFMRCFMLIYTILDTFRGHLQCY